ncbi:hypothetical protein [Microbacterium sp. gxy059]|uniref:hypothetical protein n=1 Tax=Microbacterium sp. gxy059 TaxID=2957199 RepID=UPI003D9915BB
MTEEHPHTVPAPSPRLSWPLVVGLAALALLWPLTGVLGAGGVGRAVAVIAVTLLVWIGVVGLGRIPRPVLTLTTTGAAYGVIYLVAIAVIASPLALLAWYTVVATAALGALAGLAAWGVQAMMRR